MTKQDLINERKTIISEITIWNGKETIKKHMDLMLFLCEDGYDGTVEELTSDVINNLRVRRKKSGHKLAEIIGNNENGSYSIMDKKWIYN